MGLGKERNAKAKPVSDKVERAMRILKRRGLQPDALLQGASRVFAKVHANVDPRILRGFSALQKKKTRPAK